MSVDKFTCHSKRVLAIAARFGWLPGARYTNLRDVRHVTRVGFLDIDWRSYNYPRHLHATKKLRPRLTVARDIEHPRQLPLVLKQAEALAEYADQVIIVPKHPRLARNLIELIPPRFILGFSVATQYGKTLLSPSCFDGRPVHLLGGRPDVQRLLAEAMNVVSFDCNRFTLDAAFGDYFDGSIFRRHPVGGYERCVRDSLRNINRLWKDYRPKKTKR